MALIRGRYELLREIGRGGMGAVWLARDTTLGRDVAMKRLAHDGGLGEANRGGAVESRAHREARLAASLGHKNLVAVLDLVPEASGGWLVMEYVAGPTLSQLVRSEGPLDIDRASTYLAEVATALSYAHAQGVVHRDVKPSNVLIDPLGHAKLGDFGIARGHMDESLTQTGLMVGSPAYLAPEVVQGKAATEASDLWSLGAAAHFLVTGREAYAGAGNVLSTLHRIASDPEPRLPDHGRIGVLIEHTLRRNPASRWTAAQAQQYLTSGQLPAETAKAPSPVGVRPRQAQEPEPSGRLPVLSLALGAVGLLLLIAAITLFALRGTPEPSGAPAVGARANASPSTWPSATPSRTKSPKPSPTQPSPPQEVGPTASGIESFIVGYIDTATHDQAASWRMLTPDFQAASAPYSRYQEAWQSRPNAEISNIVADPDRLTVSYDVAYADSAGRPLFSDQPTLQLAYSGGDYLIAGEY